MQHMQAQPLYMSIDVECVATGLRHNDRAVAQIALVDQARPLSARLSRLARAHSPTRARSLSSRC